MCDIGCMSQEEQQNQQQTKQQLTELIREWKQYHEAYEELSARMQQIKKQKQELTTQLATLMNDKGIPHVDLKSGRIKKQNKHIKKSMSKKYLEAQLPRFFQSIGAPQSDEMASQAVQWLLREREEVVKTDIQLIKK